jgi:hypothetical protein
MVTAFPCALFEEAYLLDHAPEPQANKISRLDHLENHRPWIFRIMKQP